MSINSIHVGTDRNAAFRPELCQSEVGLALTLTLSLPMNLLFGVPRLRGPDRLKAELQTRSRIDLFQGFNARILRGILSPEGEGWGEGKT